MAPIGKWFRKRSSAVTAKPPRAPSQATTRESFLDVSKYAVVAEENSKYAVVTEDDSSKYAVVTDAYVADAAVPATQASSQKQKRREPLESVQEMTPIATAQFVDVDPDEHHEAGTVGMRARAQNDMAVASLPAVREQENLWRQLRRNPTTSSCPSAMGNDRRNPATFLMGNDGTTSAVVQEQEKLWQQLRQQQHTRTAATTREGSSAVGALVREGQARLWDQIKTRQQQTGKEQGHHLPMIARDQEHVLRRQNRSPQPQAAQLIAEQADLLRGFQDAKEDALLKMACQASRATAMAEQHGEELYLLRTIEVSLGEAEQNQTSVEKNT